MVLDQVRRPRATAAAIVMDGMMSSGVDGASYTPRSSMRGCSGPNNPLTIVMT